MTTKKVDEKFPELQTEKGVREIKDALSKKFSDGNVNLPFGRGKRRNHFVIGILTPLSLCGRYAPETRNHPFMAPSPKICKQCVSIYKDAFTEFLEQQKAEVAESDDADRKEALKNVEETLATEPKNWWKVTSGYWDW